MSTAAGEIIVQAFREGNLTPIGHTSTAEELTEAIPRLNNLVTALFGNELGEQYRDWPAPSTWPIAQEQRHPLTPLTETKTTDTWPYPPQNSRILATIVDAPKTVFFPAAPSDGARMMLIDIGSTANITLHGNGRLIQGALSVTGTVASFDGKKWMYRADLGDWISLDKIDEAEDPMPLPEEFDDLFIAGLALRLSGRFATKLDDSVATRYTDMLNRVVARYKESSRPKSAAELRTLMRTTP